MRDAAPAARRLAPAVQRALTLVTIAVLAWILAARGESLRAVLDLTPALFALISLAAIGTHLLNGIELRVLVGHFGNRVAFRDTFSLALMVNVLNYLPMKTGTVVNGAVLRGRHGVRLAHFGALVLGSSLVHLWVAATLAGAFMLASSGASALSLGLLAAPTAAIVALMAWGRFARPGRDVDHLPAVARAAYHGVQGMADIFGDPRLMALELAINTGLVTLASLRTYWALQALSADASLAQAFVVTAFAIVLARVSVIPGGLGFREGGAAAAAGLVGLTPAVGLGAAVIDRGVDVVWLLLLGVPATLYVSRSSGHSIGEWVERARAARAAGETET